MGLEFCTTIGLVGLTKKSPLYVCFVVQSAKMRHRYLQPPIDWRGCLFSFPLLLIHACIRSQAYPESSLMVKSAAIVHFLEA